jgi:hypothetical protein
VPTPRQRAELAVVAGSPDDAPDEDAAVELALALAERLGAERHAAATRT